MVDYPKMYRLLCAAASDALDALPDTEANRAGRERLRTALLLAEELYVRAEDEEETAER